MSSRLIPPTVGSSSWQKRITSSGPRADLEVEAVEVRELLEQVPLALHHRLAGERADVARAEHRGAVRDHGDEVALRGVPVRVVGVALDLQARTRRIAGA
jgi:C4-dicarboxylate-specific signal transduction histidine kinase